MEIRTFQETDRAELRELAARASEGAPTASIWGHAESEAAVYLDPYMNLEPDSLFLAVIGGRLAGYLVGCVDSSAFPSESERMEQAIKRYRLMFKARPAAFFARALLDTALDRIRREPAVEDFADPRWPAHLHIAVAPEARGTGAADALMKGWFDRLGDTGCYLQTLVENTRAVRFFSRVGFTAHGPTPPIAGLRHEGRRVHQLTMVRG